GGSNFSSSGIPATSAKFIDPYAITLDAAGNIFMCDGNRIRKINTAGIITTLAGAYNNNGFSGDGGPATAALLNTPMGIAVDATGNIYFSDSQNERVRMINTQGIISTIAGNGNYGFYGNGGQATNAALTGPAGLAIDAAGNLFISDGKAVVRVINTAGNINIIAGDTIYGYTGDGGPATAAELEQPLGLAIHSGNLYIVDHSTYTVRVVTNVAQSGISTYNTQNSSIQIYPNPTQNIFTIETSNNEKQILNIYDVNGNLILSQTINATTSIDASNFSAGVYNISITGNNSTTNKRLVIVK
ncbi:MAG TPA: T9SS type A sorting domain-containing protein, partial [Bacteroidia bacterium]|nr:T9SS type A sorting domain-containing protein [Bacteroidia bacterium]